MEGFADADSDGPRDADGVDDGGGRGGEDDDSGRGDGPRAPSRRISPHHGHRARWKFLKWQIMRTCPNEGPCPKVQAFLTLGDVHFATATELAQQGESAEVVADAYARAENAFSSALASIKRGLLLRSAHHGAHSIIRNSADLGEEAVAASTSIPEPADLLSAEFSSAVLSAGSGGSSPVAPSTAPSPIAPLASGSDGGEGKIPGKVSDGVEGGSSSTAEPPIAGAISEAEPPIAGAISEAELPVNLLRAAVGLAKVALARNESALCIRRLEGLPATEPVVLQMRGEAHAALGELETARAELTQAASLWWRANDGLHEQATLVELERVRRRLDAQHVDTGRLSIFHAAPLVEHVEVTAPRRPRRPPRAGIACKTPPRRPSCTRSRSRSASGCARGASCAPRSPRSSDL